MQNISLQPVASQKFVVILSGQSTSISIYTLADGNLYIDIKNNAQIVVSGVLCLNLNKIVRDSYLGFIGDFIFNDTQGSSDPTYDGLGTRYELLYLTEAEAGNV
jgi:hypothetical protein